MDARVKLGQKVNIADLGEDDQRSSISDNLHTPSRSTAFLSSSSSSKVKCNGETPCLATKSMNAAKGGFTEFSGAPEGHFFFAEKFQCQEPGRLL